MEVEPVEPQSLKKLSFKSLKRALDLFSPIHGHLATPDAERFRFFSLFLTLSVISLTHQPTLIDASDFLSLATRLVIESQIPNLYNACEFCLVLN